MAVFITGDRGLPAMHPAVLVAVGVEIVRAQARGEAIATGMENGVEEAVRFYGAETGCLTTLVGETPRDAEGKRDYLARIASMSDDVHFVYIGDPTISRSAAALLTLPDDRATLALLV